MTILPSSVMAMLNASRCRALDLASKSLQAQKVKIPTGTGEKSLSQISVTVTEICDNDSLKTEVNTFTLWRNSVISRRETVLL